MKTNLNYTFSGLPLQCRVCFLSSTNKSYQNRLAAWITGESILSNLMISRYSKSCKTEEKNDLFSQCMEGGMLIIEDGTNNRFIHNPTEEFRFMTKFCRVIHL